MKDIECIESHGKIIGRGKDRKVYLLNDKVYKISYEGSAFKNAGEFRKYLVNKDRNPVIYNPVIDISPDSKVLEVEKCISIVQFIENILNIKLTDLEMDKMFDIRFSDLVKKYKFESYLPADWSDINEFLFKTNNDDFEESQYFRNWGYNIKRKHLVLLDYAD